MKEFINKRISFKHVKHGTVVVRLLSFNDSHIQVQLETDLYTDTRIWFKGHIRLFDRDNISFVMLIDERLIIPNRKLSKRMTTNRSNTGFKKKYPQTDSKTHLI